MRMHLLIILLVLLPLASFAQKKKKDKRTLKEKVQDLLNTNVQKDSLLIYKEEQKDTIPDVELKKKKNHFFGVKTKRAYTVKKISGRTVIEDFYILPEGVEVDPYVLQIFVHDQQREEVKAVRGSKGRLVNRVLHGPYKKLVNDVVVEEGMFFYGTKHQRWVLLDRQNKLLQKEHYHKGWYRDSEITYYDGDAKKRIKSVTPIQYGKKQGMYIQFFPNGQVAMRGRYEFDKKVGVWEEFHQVNRAVIKREIQYPPDPFQKDFKSFIRKEWDTLTNLIYVSPRLSKTG
ncbi:MAG: hypothetical protein Roseis2KO_06440 [Roseivirga sp.]